MDTEALESLVREWTKSTQLKFLGMADYETILDKEDLDRQFDGKSLETHVREFFELNKLDNAVVDVLIDNLNKRNWPNALKTEQDRANNRNQIEKLNVYGSMIERNKYEFNTHEIDYAFGVAFKHVNGSLGDDYNLPVGYILCFKFEKL